MQAEYYMPEYPEGRVRTSAGMKAIMTMLTLTVGVSLAGAAIYAFRAHPKIVPYTKIVKEYVPEIVYRDRIVEVPVERKAPIVVNPEPQADLGRWIGCWRMGKNPLPMIEIAPMKGNNAVEGRFAPTWGGAYHFKSNVLTVGSNSIEFKVGDQMWMVHLRMTLTEDNTAVVEGFVDAAEWLTMMENANRQGGNVQLLLAKRIELEAMSKKLGQMVEIGKFKRIIRPF
jgi:hypothetical protein